MLNVTVQGSAKDDFSSKGKTLIFEHFSRSREIPIKRNCSKTFIGTKCIKSCNTTIIGNRDRSLGINNLFLLDNAIYAKSYEVCDQLTLTL